MSGLSDHQAREIAQQLATRLRGDAPRSAPSVNTGDGIFETLDQAVAAAQVAFHRLGSASLELRERIIAAIRSTCLEHAAELAAAALAETALGRLEDKVAKNRLVAEKTPGTEALFPAARSGDRGLTLMEPAPFGVIGSITPTTNPTSTIICNGIGMVAAGNSVVFNAHPSAKSCSAMTIALINRAVVAVGGPPDLLTGVAEPTIATAKGLMAHPAVGLLVVTGGAGVVKEAMGSGKRAICAGPGNPPVVVDETADLERAARDVVAGASLDNNIICVDEKELLVVDRIAAPLLEAMGNHGAHHLPAGKLGQLEKLIFAEQRGEGRAGVMNKELIGQDAATILQRLGIQVDPRIRLVTVEVPVEHPLVWSEQMMPVLPVVRIKDAESAIDTAILVEQGNRHSAAYHSLHLGRLSRMAREINSSIFVKNGPCAAGLGLGAEGHCSFSIASPTGEGLTGPLSFSRQRRCVVVDHFRIV